MAPDVDSEFVLYEDDGVSNDYQEGAYLKTTIAATAGTRTEISFTNEGNYETAVETISLDVIHREKAPFYVQVDGKNCLISFTAGNTKRRRKAGITARD